MLLYLTKVKIQYYPYFLTFHYPTFFLFHMLGIRTAIFALPLFFPFVSHYFFPLFACLFHFTSLVGTLATDEDGMDCYCFFLCLLFFFFSLLIYSNVQIVIFLLLAMFFFCQLQRGCVVPSCRRCHRFDPVTALHCQALHPVALGGTPPLWRCLSFVVPLRCC